MNDKPELKVLPDGTHEWYLNGKLHRQDGPAVERPDGYREWYLNGKRHRQDGPAIEWPDGTCVWWLKGKLHRPDGSCGSDFSIDETELDDSAFQGRKL
jgi:hypothetical protein